MAVLRNLIKAGDFEKSYEDEVNEYRNDLVDAIHYLEEIQTLLIDACNILKMTDEKIQDAFDNSVYVYDGKGLRVGMGADALKASGIEKTIPSLEKRIKDLKNQIRRI